jgi:hypothetical protein
LATAQLEDEELRGLFKTVEVSASADHGDIVADAEVQWAP